MLIPASYDLIFTRLMNHEGRYSNNPADPGGETMWGVTKRVAIEFGYTSPMKLLPKELAKEISYKGYWLRAQADNFHIAIGWQLMDATYNHGYGNAARFLQRAVHVADDGFIGPRTLYAVAAQPLNDTLLYFIAEREEFMTELSTWHEFGKGWIRRMIKNLRYAAADN